MQLITLSEALKHFKKELSDFYSTEELSSISILVFGYLLHYSRLDIHTNTDQTLTQEKFELLNSTIIDLKEYKPIQYIIGEVEFYNIKLKINRNVLIPRPETEELVAWILESNTLNAPQILDIGTGSGCIAISLAKNIVNAQVFGIDKSMNALETAIENAEKNDASVHFYEFDIIENEQTKFDELDIIVSNPPYVLEKEKDIMKKNVLDYEPHLALFVDNDDPLLFYREICKMAIKSLKDFSFLYFEINEKYGAECELLMREYGFLNIELKQDINGKYRMIRGQKQRITT